MEEREQADSPSDGLVRDVETPLGTVPLTLLRACVALAVGAALACALRPFARSVDHGFLLYIVGGGGAALIAFFAFARDPLMGAVAGGALAVAVGVTLLVLDEAHRPSLAWTLLLLAALAIGGVLVALLVTLSLWPLERLLRQPEAVASLHVPFVAGLWFGAGALLSQQLGPMPLTLTLVVVSAAFMALSTRRAHQLQRWLRSLTHDDGATWSLGDIPARELPMLLGRPAEGALRHHGVPFALYPGERVRQRWTFFCAFLCLELGVYFVALVVVAL